MALTRLAGRFRCRASQWVMTCTYSMLLRMKGQGELGRRGVHGTKTPATLQRGRCLHGRGSCFSTTPRLNSEWHQQAVMKSLTLTFAASTATPFQFHYFSRSLPVRKCPTHENTPSGTEKYGCGIRWRRGPSPHTKAYSSRPKSGTA